MEIPTVNPIIGANYDLSKYILDPEEIIMEVTRAMQGLAKIYNTEGKLVENRKVGDPRYSDEAIAWFQAKLRVVLNKNTYLSRVNTEEQMFNIQWEMQRSFIFELATKFKNLDLDGDHILELGNVHLFYLNFATRRALFEGDKTFLTKTTSETTQKLQQHVTEAQEKKGILGLFGK